MCSRRCPWPDVMTRARLRWRVLQGPLQKVRFFAVLAGVAAGSACSAAGAAPAADETELRACFAKSLPQRSLSESIVITQTAADGTRRRIAGDWYWRINGDGQNGMLRLTAPKDLAGAAYLFLGSGQRQDYYLYLPSVKKVRHVTGATTAQSLFESGISAFDLKFLFSGLRGGRLQPLGAVTEASRPATRWRYQPPADPDILYDRVDLTVDDDWCLPVRAELYGGVPWKTLTIEPNSVQRVEGRWLATVLNLKDLREGSTSRIELRDPVIDADLSPDLFNPSRYYRSR